MPAAMSSSVLYSFTMSMRPSALLRSMSRCSHFSRDPLHTGDALHLLDHPLSWGVRLPLWHSSRSCALISLLRKQLL